MSSIARPDRSASPHEAQASVAASAAAASPPTSPTANGLSTRLPRSLGTLAVVVTLALVALWGHQSDWTLPKFSALAGGGSPEAEDWCKEHNVPESQCIECQLLLSPAA